MKLSDGDQEALARFFGTSFNQDFGHAGEWADTPDSVGVIKFLARKHSLGELFLLFGALEHLRDAQLDEPALRDLIYGQFEASFDPTLPDKNGTVANGTLQSWLEDLVTLLRDGISQRASTVH